MQRLFASSWRYLIGKIITARQISQCSSHKDCHLITSLNCQLTWTPVSRKAGPSGKACSGNPHCCQYNPSCNQAANHRTNLCFSKIMGKNREGLVSKHPCSQNIVHPSSWALCSALGFRSEHFLFANVLLHLLTSHSFRENSCYSKCLLEYGRQTQRTDVKGKEYVSDMDAV